MIFPEKTKPSFSVSRRSSLSSWTSFNSLGDRSIFNSGNMCSAIKRGASLSLLQCCLSSSAISGMVLSGMVVMVSGSGWVIAGLVWVRQGKSKWPIVGQCLSCGDCYSWHRVSSLVRSDFLLVCAYCYWCLMTSRIKKTVSAASAMNGRRYAASWTYSSMVVYLVMRFLYSCGVSLFILLLVNSDCKSFVP